jgi:hypothetical protein
MTKIVTSAAFAASTILANGAAGANLIDNGNFANVGNVYVENTGQGADDLLTPGATDIPGWTNVGGPGGTGNEMWIQPHNEYGLTSSPANPGGFFVDLTGEGNVRPFGGLKQSIATTDGRKYVLTFYLGGDSYYDKHAPVLIVHAGHASGSYTFTPTARNQWVRETLDFTARASSTIIKFRGKYNSPNYYIGLDSVSVRPRH